MNYKCISADSHIDLSWLPPDLFITNSSAAFRDRLPYVVDSADGRRWVTKRGTQFGFVCGLGGFGRKYVPGVVHRADVMAAEGIYSEQSMASRRITDPEQRIKDQDQDGVQAEVLYGVIGAVGMLDDAEAACEMAGIYNDWLADFCKTHPDRLWGLALIAPTNVDRAVEELRRVARLGARGVELSISHDMVPLVSADWEPFWKVLNETGLPIHFHTISARQAGAPPNLSKQEARVAWSVLVSMFQLHSSEYLISMIFSGVLERYRNIRMVLGESGIGWIPYMLERMDYLWEEQFRDLPIVMKPSEYWRRQCKATFQYDELGVRLLDMLGAETLMWSSDFPHADGVWPESQDFIRRQFGHLPEAVRKQIICDNALSLYGAGARSTRPAA